jgi:putative nucleotidyltransferase with HDIG domain
MEMEGKPAKENRILVVDDEPGIRNVLSEYLAGEGFAVETAENGEAALNMLHEGSFELVIADMEMPGMGGMALLNQVVKLQHNVKVIIITGFGTIETAIEALKLGASDYICKPFKLDEILVAIRRTMERLKLERENIQLRETISLYQLSEVMSLDLEIGNILLVIAESIFKETGADAVELLLRDGPDSFRLKDSLAKDEALFSEFRKYLNLKKLMSMHERDLPVRVDEREITGLFPAQPPNARIYSFISSPIRIRNSVEGMINCYCFTRGPAFTEGQRKFTAIFASRAASAMENANLYDNLKKSFRETIEGLAHALEAKDEYTRGHSERVTDLAGIICDQLGLKPEEKEKICQAGLLHDIGKIGLRVSQLNRPGKLTPEEMEMFKAHCSTGKKILEPITFLSDTVPYVYHHHERYDGAGYPEGKVGEDIPLGARILCVADSYDVMISDRPYRKALSKSAARKELEKCSGSQFDAGIVKAFCAYLDGEEKKKKSKS